MVTVQFTPDLSALQGVLISADYVHSFTNITTKGGNEKKIEFIIDSVRNFLKKERYLNDKGIIQDVSTMQRYALYIVLNSELPILNDLVSTDSSIDLLIWTVPTIAKCLMSEMLWKLSMDKFVYEIIAFSYPQLSIEVADALILYMKYFNPTECLTQLKTLSTACFRILCRIYFFQYNENQLKSAFSNFQRCMIYFCNPPNEGKLEQLSKDNLYRYYGKSLHTMLTILWECFNCYIATQTYDLPESVAIYEITYKRDCIKKNDYKPCQSTDKSHLEILKNCLTDLLDNCKKLVMGVNLDIFCAWSEFEDGGANMQETIGLLSYKVRQELMNSELCDHPVVSMLEQISRKPTDIQDIINTAESSVIIENIGKETQESIQWLQGLINTDRICRDTALLQALESNLHKLNEGHFQKLLNNLKDNAKSCTENKEFINSLMIKAYQQCNITVKHEFLDFHFRERCFNDLLETPKFTSMLTEIFNKLAISPDSDLSDILTVFIQNPRKVYVKIFNSAVENEQQMNLMFKVMTFLSKYSNHFYSDGTEACLMIVLKNAIEQELESEAKQENLINFVSKLKHAKIILGTKLLLSIIMPQLHNSLINKDYIDICMQCKLIRTSYTVEDLIEYRAPMLAMLAQVMEQVRWKINTFDVICPSTLSVVIDLQASLINTYRDPIPEFDVYWLKSKARELDPLNMYYFRLLWNPEGDTFVEVISGIQVHKDMDRAMLTLWLTQVLCSSILQEWEYIWMSLEEFGDDTILELFHNAMISVLEAEKSNRTNNTWACLLYCFENLVHCIRYKFLKEPLSDSQVISVTNKLVTVIKLLQEDNMEEFGTIVIPLFAYIAQRKNEYTVDVTQIIQSNIQHSKLSGMINNLFSNGSN